MSGSDVKGRDIQADYKAAMIEEYESYARAGRAEQAEEVAAELKLTFGWTPGKTEKAAEPQPPVERAVPDASEAETPEKAEPVKRGPGRPRKTE